MKIDRTAFLYMEGTDREFAQCSTCYFWISGTDRCVLHRATDRTEGGDSCGLYVNGEPQEEATPLGLTTPKVSGLVSREVRCENCSWFDADTTNCDLYDQLNSEMPDAFNLNIKVRRRACCNAQTPKGASQ